MEEQKCRASESPGKQSSVVWIGVLFIQPAVIHGELFVWWFWACKQLHSGQLSSCYNLTKLGLRMLRPRQQAENGRGQASQQDMGSICSVQEMYEDRIRGFEKEEWLYSSRRSKKTLWRRWHVHIYLFIFCMNLHQSKISTFGVIHIKVWDSIWEIETKIP